MALDPKLRKLFTARLPRHASATVLTYLMLTRFREEAPSRKQNSQKPNLLFRQYKNYRMLIRLRMWCMTNQATSLEHAQYASHPRNPE